MTSLRLGSAPTIMAVFFTQALLGGGIYTRLPDIQISLGLGKEALGAALAAGALGSLLSNAVAGRVTDALGPKRVLVLGLPSLAGASAAAGAAPVLPVFAAAFIAQMALFAVINVAMNVEADRVETQLGRKVMSRCHGMWSLGMLLASGIGVVARAAGSSPGAHLGAVALVAGVAAVALFAPMRPAPRAGYDNGPPRRFARPSARVMVLVGFVLAGGLGQMTAQQWSVIFMRDNFAAPDWVDTLVLPVFLAAMALSRLLADGWVHRYGSVPVARALTALAMAGAAAVAGAPGLWVALAGFGLIGFGVGVHFPLMMTAAARTPGRPAADSVASAVLLTSGLMMVAPYAMGAIGETAGLRWGYAATLPFYVITLALSGVALRTSPPPGPRDRHGRPAARSPARPAGSAPRGG